MLVLSCKKHESIIIGTTLDVEIYVVEVRGNQVRLGIKAPKQTPVHRRKVFDAIWGNNRNEDKETP